MVFFFPIKHEIHINNILAASNNRFSLNSFENVSGVISAPVPIIKNEFNIQEPIKFPTANPPSFFITAITDVIISGRAVPIATIVNPIILSLIPKIVANMLDCSTTKSPPNFSNIIPIIIYIIETKILNFCISTPLVFYFYYNWI